MIVLILSINQLTDGKYLTWSSSAKQQIILSSSTEYWHQIVQLSLNLCITITLIPAFSLYISSKKFLITREIFSHKLQIWDTAGQERFRTITQSYYRSANGVMITYDISNKETFKNVARWTEDVKRYSLPNVFKILVGNKKDLDAIREVSLEEAQNYGAHLGMADVLETSAKVYKICGRSSEGGGGRRGSMGSVEPPFFASNSPWKPGKWMFQILKFSEPP